MEQSTPVNRHLAMLDIGLIIAGAAADRRTIKLRSEAMLITKRHPNAGMTEDEISAAIALLAAEKGLVAD